MPSAHFFTQRKAIYASDIITRATNIGGSYLESRREYDAINRIFLAVGDNAVFGNPFHAVAIGVDQFDARAVESL